MLASTVGLLLMNKCSLYFVYISNNFLVKIQDFCVKIHLKMDLRKALRIFLCESPRNFMFFHMFLVHLRVYQPCSIIFVYISKNLLIISHEKSCIFSSKLMEIYTKIYRARLIKLKIYKKIDVKKHDFPWVFT